MWVFECRIALPLSFSLSCLRVVQCVAGCQTACSGMPVWQLRFNEPRAENDALLLAVRTPNWLCFFRACSAAREDSSGREHNVIPKPSLCGLYHKPAEDTLPGASQSQELRGHIHAIDFCQHEKGSLRRAPILLSMQARRMVRRQSVGGGCSPGAPCR
jgi:hypothetical protein